METVCRLQLSLTGTVQGVGFRPFAYRLACEEGLSGWIRNDPGGVAIEVEGPRNCLLAFVERLETEKPPLASIYSMEPCWLEPSGLSGMEILESSCDGATEPVLLPDLMICPVCSAEIRDPANRRFGYPFTNCTHCGPRYSIIESLPYDRGNTSMKHFAMCPDCRREYGDTADRRFHAQPVSCPACGPSLALYGEDGSMVESGRSGEKTSSMIAAAADCLNGGGIVALLGLGGVQLLTDARNEKAVCRLRERKRRDARPFALMAPSEAVVREIAFLSPEERRVLSSPAAPIVLLRRRDDVPPECLPAPSVCMFSPWVGVMLPTTPLHHLLLDSWGGLPVATSGNLSDEPLCVSPEEALCKLAGVADLFLMHDRPVLRPVDDSVVRVWRGRELVVRRARGYAPLPVCGHGGEGEPVILALGGQMKNALGWRVRGRSVLSQHMGDLDTEASLVSFRREADDLGHLLHASPELVVVDSHPDYEASLYGRDLAERKGLPLVEVQHHVAHVLACMEENEVPFPCLGVAWDGTGYGPDGTVWGGEWFALEETAWKRVGHLRTFHLPGGDAAVRDPRRVAFSLLAAPELQSCRTLRGRLQAALAPDLSKACRLMIERGLNAPLCSSMGRIFDAVAFFLGFDGLIRCEGQAAMQLEAWAWEYPEAEWGHVPPLSWGEGDTGGVMDWVPALQALETGLAASCSRARLAWCFHDGLAELIVTHALKSGRNRVCVGGGCFQNVLLLELLMRRAERAGVTLHVPQRVPAHDGGLAVGQIAAVLHHYPAY